MRRNNNGEIFFERLNIFEPISHQISIQNNINTKWECIYEHVRVFTDANNPITALSFCRHGRLNCYDTTQETDTTRTVLKDDHPHLQGQREIINQQFIAFQNCFGFCVLDGMFWLNLLPETLNQIILEDNYLDTENVNQDHLVIYYQNDLPVHISKYVHRENRFLHKMGCNTHLFSPTEDVRNIYTYDRIRRIVKNIN